MAKVLKNEILMQKTTENNDADQTVPSDWSTCDFDICV